MALDHHFLVLVVAKLIDEVVGILAISPSPFSTHFLMELRFNSSTLSHLSSPQTVNGYPHHPYISILSHQLCQIFMSKKFSLLEAIDMPGICETFPLTESILWQVDEVMNKIFISTMESYGGNFNIPLIYYSVLGLFSGTPRRYIKLHFDHSPVYIDSAILNDLSTLLCHLGPRGILWLLRVRTTCGSLDITPPRREHLIDASVALHTPQLGVEDHEMKKIKTNKMKMPSALTVSARALCKHAHRSSECYWGTGSGSELQKNQHALATINRLLDTCVWVNIHYMGGMGHGERGIIEIRDRKGYGARWVLKNRPSTNHDTQPILLSTESSSSPFGVREMNWHLNRWADDFIIKFRGFVEPTALDGHASGWKH